MAEIELTPDNLIVRVEGFDKLWALKSSLEISLVHVTGAAADPERARQPEGLRAPGTHVPRVITAGTFYREGRRVFWDVRDPNRAISIRLHDERYDELVVEVDDPVGTAATIERALPRGPRGV